MSTLILIIIITFLISLISFIGALALFLKEELLNRIVLILVAFAAGALLGGAFLHLLPEAINALGVDKILTIFLFLIFGFCLFFLLENFINLHHHPVRGHSEVEPFSYLILISDAFHNFLDGVVIAAAFIVAFPAGIVTALAVAFHEIPQEIGDFGILVYGGFEKTKALFLNFLSASTVIIGGIVGFFLVEKTGQAIIFLLPFAAGNFIYIACSDLIPEIKHGKNIKKSIVHFCAFLLGIALMALIRFIAGE